ncbi:MAG: hypothetical protein M3R63_03230, partial [Actinomycetota bacterium]|nr:hypothetical protein [Actinomycetota bacterium]
TVTPELERTASELADELREAHVRVRRAARGRHAGALGIAGLSVSPQLPVDVLGVYVYLPAAGAP